MINRLTLEEAYRELKSVENNIDLIETKRKIRNEIHAVNIKDIIVSGGKINNSAILDGILAKDEYSEELSALYQEKASFELYIWREIELFRDVKQGLIISFLKNHLNFKWDKIEKTLNLTKRQCQRYYAEYRGYTPSDNVGHWEIKKD